MTRKSSPKSVFLAMDLAVSGAVAVLADPPHPNIDRLVSEIRQN